MKFYFSRVPEKYSTGQEQDYFKHEGNYFYYMAEVTDDTFIIRDTCGRYVPFDRTDAKDFGLAAFVVEKAYANQDEVSALVDKRTDELSQLIQFFSKND